MIEIIHYETEHGVRPFFRYVDGMRDTRAKTKVLQAVNKMELGLAGGIKALDHGLFECKVDEGEGHRIYFCYDGQAIIVLLSASSKKDQRREIECARNYHKDYKRQKAAFRRRTKS